MLTELYFANKQQKTQNEIQHFLKVLGLLLNEPRVEKKKTYVQRGIL